MFKKWVAAVSLGLAVVFGGLSLAQGAGQAGISELAQELGLSGAQKGLLVISLDPVGLGQQIELQPGDILVNLQGASLARVVDIDLITGYWLRQAQDQLELRILRQNERVQLSMPINVDEFGMAVNLEAIANWPSIRQGAFSYADFLAENVNRMISNYAEESQLIEEISGLAEFDQHMQDAEELLFSGDEDALY
jgi:hypothetical protein